MEEEDGFIPNLASMLEVSLVEDADPVLSVRETRGPTEITDDAKINTSVNGVAPSDAESRPEGKVTDVQLSHVGEQNEVHHGQQELLPSGKDDEEIKQLFHSTFKDTKMVMYLRLHCTVCDCHIGCTPVAAFTMAFHKCLRVLICKDCETFYGNGDFVCGDDGSETFCRWCGQGGHLYCCSICPSVFCKKCIRRNLGRRAVKEIEVSNDWVCYRCNMHPIREHRALCWGLRTFLKEQSKDETKVPEDEAEESPGFNPVLCCQGEKLPYHRASQPLRPIIFPFMRKTQNVKDMRTVTLPNNQMNVSHDKLASGGKVTFTTPSTVPKTSLDIARIPVNAAASSSRLLGVVRSQAPSTGQELSVRSPTLRNVPNAVVKLPSPSVTVEQGIRIKNSSLYVLQKEQRVTYESAFVSHLAKTGVQSATFHQNQTPVLNTAVTVTSPIKDSAPANFEASLPLTCIQSPLRAVLLSPRPNSNVGSRVNKVFVNQNTNSGSVTCTSTLHLGAAQRVQQNALTPVHTTYLINRSKDPPKLVPLSRFHTMSVPAAGPNQFTRPPHPKTVVSENTTESKTSTLSVSGGGDDDIVEVFSNVHDLNAQKVECKWMMEIFRGVSCTSRLFLYHADILRQKFERERSAKGRSHIIGKFYRLLKKVLKRLSVQKEHVPKGFSDWLNAEKAKHGIPTTEGGQDSSPIKDKGSDTEVGQEQQLLLDMEITCESDHEDSSDTTTAAQQDLNGCNENLSDSDDDSDDPFSDCESKEQEKVIPVLKPILSHTVREILGDKSTRKLVLHLLREHDSKTANIKSKIISSAEKIQSADGNEESAAKERECEISKLKTCVHTDILTEGTSSNGIALLLHSSEHGTDSGTKKEKSVRTEAIDSNGKYVQDLQMKTSSSGTQGKARKEESERRKSAYKKCRVVQDSQMETSSSGTEDKAGNEVSGRSKSPYKNSGVVEDTQMKTSCSGIEDKAGNEVRGRSKSPYKNSGVVQDSQKETSCSGIEDKAGNEVSGRSKSPYKNSGVVEDTQVETSSNGMEGKAGNESERSKSPCKSSVTVSRDANTEVVRDSQVESSLIKSEGKTVNEKCDTHEKCQTTKRKYYCVSSTVVPSGMETKRVRTRSAVMVSDRLRKNASPVTGFTDSFQSAVQKRLIKPCFVSVVRLNRTN